MLLVQYCDLGVGSYIWNLTDKRGGRSKLIDTVFQDGASAFL